MEHLLLYNFLYRMDFARRGLYKVCSTTEEVSQHALRRARGDMYWLKFTFWYRLVNILQENILTLTGSISTRNIYYAVNWESANSTCFLHVDFFSFAWFWTSGNAKNLFGESSKVQRWVFRLSWKSFKKYLY